jgi:hypothetical protein
MLFYGAFELYRSIGFFLTSDNGRALGIFVDASILLSGSVYTFINVRRFNKKFKEENAKIEADSDKNVS